MHSEWTAGILKSGSGFFRKKKKKYIHFNWHERPQFQPSTKDSTCESALFLRATRTWSSLCTSQSSSAPFSRLLSDLKKEIEKKAGGEIFIFETWLYLSFAFENKFHL